MVMLTVEPREVLVDDDVRVRVTGVTPWQSVVLGARTRDDADVWWESSAEFRADDHGEVDPARQPALSGSYIGVEPMGLFWSMTPTTDGPHPPLFNWRRREPSRVTLTVEADGAAVAEAVLDRRFVSLEVVEHQVDGDGPHGRLFVPPGPGPHPAVLVFGGSGGGLMWAEDLAPLLASRGFAALALAYFAYPGLPPLLQDIPLEYFEGAISWLRAREEVQDEPVAVMGMSMGGQVALILGATFPDAVGAIVSYVPSSVRFGSNWTFRGESAPFVPRLTPAELERFSQGEPIPLTPRYLARLANASANVLEAAAIPVERARCPVLMLSAEDDQMWPCAPMADGVIQRLKARMYSYPYAHQRYPGAGHYLRLPHVPPLVGAVWHPVHEVIYAVGGSRREHAIADADSWRRTLGFLREHIGSGDHAP